MVLKELKKLKKMNKSIDGRYEKLFAELVPMKGKSETLEGELLRAISKVYYRWNNSGDMWWKGYGTETAGSSASFLTRHPSPIKDELVRIFHEIDGNYGPHSVGETVTNSMYEQGLDEALKVVVEFVESQKGNYTPNSTDMLSFNPAYENCDDRDDDDDDDYDYDVDDDYRGRW